jgi:uncharacterized membrane protein YheB (UPF0754 family)
MNVILPIAIGALIGLFTNWLAIVMLFRPWKEIRLFGKRLPFTPGLIPSRQNELADKLGQIVEEDLLTPEGLAKSLKRPELDYAVKKAAIRSLGDMLEATPTAGELTERLFGEGARDKVEGFVTEKALHFLRSEEGQTRLAAMSDTLFDHLSASLATEDVRRSLARGLAVPLHESLSSGATTWAEALPVGARAMIEERLEAQVRPLLQGTSRWLEEPQVVHAISKMLGEKVENIPLIGPMAKGFLTPERVADDIVPRLQSVLLSSSTEELVGNKLREMTGEFWTKPVRHTLGNLSADDLGGVLENMLQVVAERSLGEGGDGRALLRSLLVGGLSAGANERVIGDLLHRLLETAAAWNVRDFYIRRTESADRIIERSWQFLRDKMIDSMPLLLEALSVRTVVRDQVAAYPISTLEKLIVSVVNNELKMITWLGGLLGGLIGLIQVLVSR